ncbi:30S ribosomal protein S6 [Conexibacter sp. SYSU D00693]|uniref:30S ribosomal protein S6 n=1 Tax=Conexibacter sp. SYSU D00693 TaxID=2812560 RepID=UPI00196A6EA0|nr:30S ribosomal protein S6 [Conexibacter sp. SYSU D00693]
MPKTPPTYDLVLLLDTAAEEGQRQKIRSEVERILSSNGATVVGTHEWGTRKTAYEIRHKGDAEYHLLQFQGSPEVPGALDRYLRITDGVVRFRVVKLAPGTPAPPDLTEAAVPSEDESAAEPAVAERL